MALLAKVRGFKALPWLEKIQRVEELYWLFKTQYYYKRFWCHIGERSKVIAPMRLRNVHYMDIGDNVIINREVFLLAIPENCETTPRLTIGDGCVIGHMNHIACIRDVRIGRNVLTADRVYISDHSHDFTDVLVPILAQGVVSKGGVSIGDGSWLGENAVVLSCSIGRNCVVGANSVVLQDIPDYTVAVGAPARVVRRFDPASGRWHRVGS